MTRIYIQFWSLGRICSWAEVEAEGVVIFFTFIVENVQTLNRTHLLVSVCLRKRPEQNSFFSVWSRSLIGRFQGRSQSRKCSETGCLEVVVEKVRMSGSN